MAPHLFSQQKDLTEHAIDKGSNKFCILNSQSTAQRMHRSQKEKQEKKKQDKLEQMEKNM